MPANVATAYVQIIPSAQGIGGGIAQALGGDAAAAGAGASIGGKLVGALKGVIAAAGLGAALGKALTEGAALEQSLGGVETLFKDSADQVIAAADNAYRTAGVSANKYMEQVTSFSATLLQGLGGDTAAAAGYADKAIVQMADNANKMGTDIASIQYAYQGFAKDNYTMLDNLKLGYGGTQAEMARLINDSGVLGDSIEVTAETVNDVPFDKIIDAIGVIQDDLGITGTTAQEAATTLSGSFASMQAAASNVLADLTLGRDIGPALEGLAQTVSTFLVGNLLPAVWNILSALPGALVTFVQSLGPQLAAGLVSGLNAISPQLGGAVETAFGFLKENGNLIAAAIVSITSAFAGLKALNIATSIGGALVKVGQSITTFMAAAQNASSLLALAQGAFTAFVNPVGLVVAAVAALAGGFLYLWNTCEPFKQFWLDLGTNIANFVTGAGQAIVTFFTVTLPQGFHSVVASVAAWGTSLIASAIEVGSGFVTNISTFFSQLPYNIGNFIGSALARVINWAAQMIGKAQQLGSEFLNSVITFFAQLPVHVQNFVSAALANVATWSANMVQSAVQMGMQFLTGVTSFFTQLPENIANFLSSVLAKVSEWGASMVQKAKEAAAEFGRCLLDGLASLPGRVADVGKNIVQGLWNGITGAGGWLMDQIGGFVNGIIDGFTSNLDINSPSKVMASKVGRFIPAGIAEGMIGNMNSVKTAISSILDTLQTGFSGQSARLRSAIAAGTPAAATVGSRPDRALLDAIHAAARDIVQAVQENGGDLVIGDDTIYRSYNRARQSQSIMTGGAY